MKLVDDDEFDELQEERMIDAFLDGEIQMTPYYELEKRGCAPPFLEDLTENDDVTRELTNLVWNLADLSIYIDSVDHLSDRELYAALLSFCDEPNIFFPGSKRACCGWSPIGGGTEDDNQTYLRYYASDEERERWKTDYCETLPPKDLIPFPRPWIPVWDPPAD
jgi:hypothetical protein